MIASFGFKSITSSVVTICSGCFSFSSTASGFDFRRIFFDGFFGLPSSSSLGFSSISDICSSCCFSSSVTITLVSSSTSGLSAFGCSNSVFDSERFDFFTDFFVSTSILDSSSSGLVSFSGFCSSTIASFGFKSITSSVTMGFCSSTTSGLDFRLMTFFDGFFGLPSSSGFSSVMGISSSFGCCSGFFSSPASSMISSETVTLVSSSMPVPSSLLSSICG
ncbi:hypothetical protein DERF_012716, partial [Dermatophagoides farinae]